MPKGGYVYIVSNVKRTVLYIGVTSNLASRSHEHKYLEGSSFTKKYNCTDLIYFEVFETIEEAIRREKQMKKWNREWKINLIKSKNPGLLDLYEDVADFK